MGDGLLLLYQHYMFFYMVLHIFLQGLLSVDQPVIDYYRFRSSDSTIHMVGLTWCDLDLLVIDHASKLGAQF